MPRRKGPKLFGISEAAALIGVHPNTLRRWADEGLVPHVKLPSGYRRWSEAQIQQIKADMGLESKTAA